MADLTPRILSVQHSPVVDSNLRIVRITHVTIMVGPYGPFSKDFPEGQDGPEAINQWKQGKVLELQAIGA